MLRAYDLVFGDCLSLVACFLGLIDSLQIAFLAEYLFRSFWIVSGLDLFFAIITLPVKQYPWIAHCAYSCQLAVETLCRNRQIHLLVECYFLRNNAKILLTRLAGKHFVGDLIGRCADGIRNLR